jgi:hypothetical protein
VREKSHVVRCGAHFNDRRPFAVQALCIRSNGGRGVARTLLAIKCDKTAGECSIVISELKRAVQPRGCSCQKACLDVDVSCQVTVSDTR